MAEGENIHLESLFRTPVAAHEHEPRDDGHAGQEDYYIVHTTKNSFGFSFGGIGWHGVHIVDGVSL